MQMSIKPFVAHYNPDNISYALSFSVILRNNDLMKEATKKYCPTPCLNMIFRTRVKAAYSSERRLSNIISLLTVLSILIAVLGLWSFLLIFPVTNKRDRHPQSERRPRLEILGMLTATCKWVVIAFVITTPLPGTPCIKGWRVLRIRRNELVDLCVGWLCIGNCPAHRKLAKLGAARGTRWRRCDMNDLNENQIPFNIKLAIRISKKKVYSFLIIEGFQLFLPLYPNRIILSFRASRKQRFCTLQTNYRLYDEAVIRVIWIMNYTLFWRKLSEIEYVARWPPGQDRISGKREEAHVDTGSGILSVPIITSFLIYSGMLRLSDMPFSGMIGSDHESAARRLYGNNNRSAGSSISHISQRRLPP
jgi:hypothetical protein